MKSKFLLPYHYKKVGWIMFYPTLTIGLIIIFTDFEIDWLNVKVLSIFPDNLMGNNRYFSFINVNITNTVVGALFLAACMLVGFTEEKLEDEFIEKMRLSSLLWAVLMNYTLLFLAFIFIYNTAFFSVMIYNMFTVLLLFIGRFRYLLFKYKKLELEK